MPDRTDALLHFLSQQHRLRRRAFLGGLAAVTLAACAGSQPTPTPGTAPATSAPSTAGPAATPTPAPAASDAFTVPGYDDPNRWKGRTLVVTS